MNNTSFVREPSASPVARLLSRPGDDARGSGSDFTASFLEGRENPSPQGSRVTGERNPNERNTGERRLVERDRGDGSDHARARHAGSTDGRSPDAHTTNASAPDASAPDASAPDNNAPDNDALDDGAPDTEAAEPGTPQHRDIVFEINTPNTDEQVAGPLLFAPTTDGIEPTPTPSLITAGAPEAGEPAIAAFTAASTDGLATQAATDRAALLASRAAAAGARAQAIPFDREAAAAATPATETASDTAAHDALARSLSTTSIDTLSQKPDLVADFTSPPAITPARIFSAFGDPLSSSIVAADTGDPALTLAPALSASALPPAGLSPNAAAQQPALTLTPGHARAVQEQLVAAISRRGEDGRLEIALDPPELGRVLIDLDFKTPQLIKATVHAENSQTHDLIRRHLADLHSALKSDGGASVELSMGERNGTGTSDPGRKDQTPEHIMQLATPAIAVSGEARTRTPFIRDGALRLDIRI